MGRRPGELPVLNLLGTRPLRLTLPLAVGVDERVRQDPEQPRLEVRAGLELMEGRIRLGEGLLHQVLGVGRIAGHPHTRRIQLIQVWQDVMLEALAALLECLSYRTHPLRDHGLQPTVLPASSAGGYNAGTQEAACGHRESVIARTTASKGHGA